MSKYVLLAQWIALLLLTLCTLKYQYGYSPYCSSYILEGVGKENLFTNQMLLSLVIISLILMTLTCLSGVVLQGEV